MDSQLIDRNPPGPGEPQTVVAEAAVLYMSGHAPTVHVTRSAYHPPPERFRFSPAVEMMAYHYRQFLAGREPLTGMAQFCLTVLETTAVQELGAKKGKAKAVAARRFNISREVLGKLGILCEEGDWKQARKAKLGQRQLTPAETRWITECVKAMIRQAGEAGPTTAPPTRLTLSDLPLLP